MVTEPSKRYRRVDDKGLVWTHRLHLALTAFWVLMAVYVWATEWADWIGLALLTCASVVGVGSNGYLAFKSKQEIDRRRVNGPSMPVAE